MPVFKEHGTVDPAPEADVDEVVRHAGAVQVAGEVDEDNHVCEPAKALAVRAGRFERRVEDAAEHGERAEPERAHHLQQQVVGLEAVPPALARADIPAEDVLRVQAHDVVVCALGLVVQRKRLERKRRQAVDLNERQRGQCRLRHRRCRRLYTRAVSTARGITAQRTHLFEARVLDLVQELAQLCLGIHRRHCARPRRALLVTAHGGAGPNSG